MFFECLFNAFAVGCLYVFVFQVAVFIADIFAKRQVGD